MTEDTHNFTEMMLFFIQLNDKKFLPRLAFRRNSTVYPLISYVNNITGCYLSHNYEPIPVFIERIRLHISDDVGNIELSEYYQLVSKYADYLESDILD